MTEIRSCTAALSDGIAWFDIRDLIDNLRLCAYGTVIMFALWFWVQMEVDEYQRRIQIKTSILYIILKVRD